MVDDADVEVVEDTSECSDDCGGSDSKCEATSGLLFLGNFMSRALGRSGNYFGLSKKGVRWLQEVRPRDRPVSFK